MSSRVQTRTISTVLKLAIIVMVAWAQAISLSHATTYGEAPHEHEGVACDVGILASEEAAILPATCPAPLVPSLGEAQPQPTASTPVWIWPPERGPPPRSPPVNHQ
jgi:hypothetical protein